MVGESFVSVSVVVPTYNGAKFLRETLDSLLAQRGFACEIIVVNDGSTDGTSQILESYGDSLRIVSQPNSGPAAAANAGIRLAKGKYIAFCDHDDLWLPNHLESLIEYFSDQPAFGLVFSNAAFFKGDKNNVHRNMVRSKYLKLLKRRMLCPADLFMKPILTTLSVVMVARSALEAIGGFDERVRFLNDSDLALRISLSYPLGYLDRVTCFHRIHAESLSAGLPAFGIGYLQVIEELDRDNPDLRSTVGKFRFRSRMFRGYLRVAKYHLSTGDRAAAIEAYPHAHRWAWWKPTVYWRIPTTPA